MCICVYMCVGVWVCVCVCVCGCVGVWVGVGVGVWVSQTASKRLILGSMAILCQRVSDDVIRCFVEQCLTDPFHRLCVADGVIDDENVLLCEAVFSGLCETFRLPRDSVSTTVLSLLTGSTLTTMYQQLPTPRQVSLNTSVPGQSVIIGGKWVAGGGDARQQRIDPIHFLVECYERVTKPGSVCFLSCPSFALGALCFSLGSL